LDTNFNLGDPNLFYPDVSAISIQSDGKIVAGGNPGAVIHNIINRFNSDGTLDAGFDPRVLERIEQPGGFGGGFVRSLALQADGKLLMAGAFKTVDGVNRYGIARLNPDASLDASFNSGSGMDGWVTAIAPQSDGKVLIGGMFDGVGGLIRSRIARLNANGSVDATFDSQLFPYPSSASDAAIAIDPRVLAIITQPDGKILVGSTSVNEKGQAGVDFVSSDLARLNADGTVDSNFNAVHGGHGLGGPFAFVCIGLQPDGRVIFGGGFDSLNGAGSSCIGRFNGDGSQDFSFNADVRDDRAGAGYHPEVRAIILQPDGKVIIGGVFTTVNDVSRTNLARLNNDGTLDNSFNPGTGPNDSVITVALQPDGKVIIGGFYTQVIARLNTDGTLDTSFNPGNGPDNGVACMALQADGRLLIGGQFASVSGFARNYVVQLSGGDAMVLNFQKLNNQLVLSWTNAGFTLQSAPAVTGTFTNLPTATSPYTNALTGPQQFFRLRSD